MIQIDVDLSEEETEAIKEIAEAEGLTFNEAVNMLLGLGIDQFRKIPIRKLVEALIREGLRKYEPSETAEFAVGYDDEP